MHYSMVNVLTIQINLLHEHGMKVKVMINTYTCLPRPVSWSPSTIWCTSNTEKDRKAQNRPYSHWKGQKNPEKIFFTSKTEKDRKVTKRSYLHQTLKSSEKILFTLNTEKERKVPKRSHSHQTRTKKSQTNLVHIRHFE